MRKNPKVFLSIQFLGNFHLHFFLKSFKYNFWHLFNRYIFEKHAEQIFEDDSSLYCKKWRTDIKNIEDDAICGWLSLEKQEKEKFIKCAKREYRNYHGIKYINLKLTNEV